MIIKHRWATMSPGRKSVLLGFSISFVLSVAGLPLDPVGHWAGVYHILFLMTGMPLGFLLGFALPSTLREALVHSSGCVPVINLLGAFLTWGFILSCMICGYLRARKRVENGMTPIRSHLGKSQPLWRMLRIVTIAILLLGVTFAVASSLLNAYRASYGCGPDYSIPFDPIRELGDSAVMGLPSIVIIAFFWIFRSGTSGNVLTLLIAAIYLAMSGHMLVDDTINSYSPCDRKGDEHSFFLLLIEMAILFLWLVLYSVAALIEYARGRNQHVASSVEPRLMASVEKRASEKDSMRPADHWWPTVLGFILFAAYFVVLVTAPYIEKIGHSFSYEVILLIGAVGLGALFKYLMGRQRFGDRPGFSAWRLALIAFLECLLFAVVISNLYSTIPWECAVRALTHISQEGAFWYFRQQIDLVGIPLAFLVGVCIPTLLAHLWMLREEGYTLFQSAKRPGNLKYAILMSLFAPALAVLAVMNQYLVTGRQLGLRNQNHYQVFCGRSMDSPERLNVLLRSAAHRNFPSLVPLLLERGARIDSRGTYDCRRYDDEKRTALMFAAYQGFPEVVDVLLEKGADLNLEDRYGHTALALSIKGGHIQVVKRLLENGAEPHRKDRHGRTALQLAVDAGHLDVIELLAPDRSFWSAEKRKMTLCESAHNGDLVTARRMLAEGTEVNARCPGELTPTWPPLHAAIRGRHVELARLLLENGANVDWNYYSHDSTPLRLAVDNGDLASVRLLLDFGANTGSKDNSGALTKACSMGQIEVATLLLDHGANINETARYSYGTPLIHAAAVGRPDVVQLLLKRGADVNAEASTGETALLAAVRQGNLEMVQALLDGGAHMNVRNRCTRETPLKTARSHGFREVEELLKARGAKE